MGVRRVNLVQMDKGTYLSNNTQVLKSHKHRRKMVVFPRKSSTISLLFSYGHSSFIYYLLVETFVFTHRLNPATVEIHSGLNHIIELVDIGVINIQGSI